MAMIDVGIKIEISAAAVSGGYSTASFTELKQCAAMPALIQPSSKIQTDFIGQGYIGEIKGKKQVTGLDFTFAYDPYVVSATPNHSQYSMLAGYDNAGTTHFMKVTYPDGTIFVLLVSVEVSLVAPTPSGELDYTLSVTPNLFSDSIDSDTSSKLIKVDYPSAWCSN